MSSQRKAQDDAFGGLADVPAGKFSEWLQGAEASLQSRKGGMILLIDSRD
jgi:hypothetical protein